MHRDPKSDERRQGHPAPSDARKRRVLSLNQVIMLLTASIALVVLVFAAISFRLSQQQLEALRAAEKHEQLAIAQETLAQPLKFYGDLVQSYARNPGVKDIISFEDTAEALEWSRHVRDALPQAIGVALFSRNGEVLGDPLAQRVGKSCIDDLHQRLESHPSAAIPVHSTVPALAHFDVTAPVEDEDGNTLGLVFVSFSINELKNALDRLAGEGGGAALLDTHDGKIFVASRDWSDADFPLASRIPVDGSDWVLKVRGETRPLTLALPTLGIVIFAGAGLIIVLMLIFNRILTRNYFQDVEDIRSALRRILDGEPVDASEFAERRSFLPLGGKFSQDLADLGNRHKDLQLESRTDALTGLANRRVFDERLDALLARLPHADQGLCVLLLDLDGFKGVNDNFGHPAGDLVLRAMGKALRRSVRATDLVSRWGGDEFAAILVGLQDEHAKNWIARLP